MSIYPPSRFGAWQQFMNLLAGLSFAALVVFCVAAVVCVCLLREPKA